MSTPLGGGHIIFALSGVRNAWFPVISRESIYPISLPNLIWAVFALERDFASLYTLWGELSQNELTNASVLSLPGETLKTDGRNLSIIGSDDVHISS